MCQGFSFILQRLMLLKLATSSFWVKTLKQPTGLPVLLAINLDCLRQLFDTDHKRCPMCNADVIESIEAANKNILTNTKSCFLENAV